jgi:hypothetical protein
MNGIRLCLLVVALFTISEATVAQPFPAKAAAEAARGDKPPPTTIRQSPGLATAASVEEQANLLREQTKAIKMLGQKIETLEARISALEDTKEGPKKKPSSH